MLVLLITLSGSTITGQSVTTVVTSRVLYVDTSKVKGRISSALSCSHEERFIHLAQFIWDNQQIL